jgi:hypothetical protein
LVNALPITRFSKNFNRQVFTILLVSGDDDVLSRRRAIAVISNTCDQEATVPAADVARAMVTRYLGSETC